MKQAIFTKFLLFSLFICFCGCSEKEDPAQITIGDSSVEYFQSRMDFPSEGGSKTITFSTNKNWVISVSESGMDVDWCSVTPSTGASGDITVTINVKENTSYGERNVVLTLTAGDAVEKLRVSQKQNDAILLSSTLYEVPMEGEEIELQVKSNVNYTVEIPEQYKSWIHGESATRSLESKDLRFKVDYNEDYEKREGEIVISDGNITEVVKIYQAGGGILVLSQNEYNIPSNGGTITVDLSSNFEYEYQMPYVDWIKLDNGTRGMSSHSLNLDILQNDLYDGRSANIRFYDPNGTANETVTIIQAQKDAIIISNKEYSVDSNQNFISIDVNSNIEFEAIVDESCKEWIRLAENPLTRALNLYKLDYVIEENKTYDKRDGTIVIKSKDNAIADTVYISQAQNDAIFIESAKDVNVSYEGGTINVDVNSNVDIELEYLQDWTHDLANTRGLEKSSHSFVVDENDTPYERTGTVIVKKLNTNLPADTMYVHQEKGFLTLEVTAGELSSLLTSYNLSLIEKLKLKGDLTGKDWLELQNLTNLQFLNISDVNTDVPASLFKNNQTIREVWMPESSEIIKSSTFENSSIEICHYSSRLKVIEYKAFYICSNLLDVNLPDTVEHIYTCAFEGCYNAHFSKLPSSIMHIDESSMWGPKFKGDCIVIPNTLDSFGPYAMANCFIETNSIVFGEKMPYIYPHIFEGADFKNVYVKATTPPDINTIDFGNRYLYVPLGSKSLYEQAPYWKDFMVIEEIDYDNFVIPGTEQYQ